jgi:hypothetical protein
MALIASWPQVGLGDGIALIRSAAKFVRVSPSNLSPAARRTRCKFDWLFVPRAGERSELEKKVFSELREHCRQRKDRHPVKATCDPDTLLADAEIQARARVLEFDFFLPSWNRAIDRGFATNSRQGLRGSVTGKCLSRNHIAEDQEG